MPNFRILNQVVAEESLTEKKLKFSLERKKNEQIKGPNFRILSQVVPEKSFTEKKLRFSLERKKNEQIMGLIRNM